MNDTQMIKNSMYFIDFRDPLISQDNDVYYTGRYSHFIGNIYVFTEVEFCNIFNNSFNSLNNRRSMMFSSDKFTFDHF